MSNSGLDDDVDREIRLEELQRQVDNQIERHKRVDRRVFTLTKVVITAFSILISVVSVALGSEILGLVRGQLDNIQTASTLLTESVAPSEFYADITILLALFASGVCIVYFFGRTFLGPLFYAILVLYPDERLKRGPEGEEIQNGLSWESLYQEYQAVIEENEENLEDHQGRLERIIRSIAYGIAAFLLAGVLLLGVVAVPTPAIIISGLATLLLFSLFAGVNRFGVDDLSIYLLGNRWLDPPAIVVAALLTIIIETPVDAQGSQYLGLIALLAPLLTLVFQIVVSLRIASMERQKLVMHCMAVVGASLGLFAVFNFYDPPASADAVGFALLFLSLEYALLLSALMGIVLSEQVLESISTLEEHFDDYIPESVREKLDTVKNWS